MKVITILIITLTLLAFKVNGQNTEDEGLLENPETRTAIFNAIASDRQLMMDFMKVARENEPGAMMLHKDENHQMEKMESKKGGSKDMSSEHKMMDMMKEKPEMMKKMMGNMLEMCEKDSVMRNQMADMMTENPKMMKMCMQKMKEKGMMHSDGKMTNKE